MNEQASPSGPTFKLCRVEVLKIEKLVARPVTHLHHLQPGVRSRVSNNLSGDIFHPVDQAAVKIFGEERGMGMFQPLNLL